MSAVVVFEGASPPQGGGGKCPVTLSADPLSPASLTGNVSRAVRI